MFNSFVSGLFRIFPDGLLILLISWLGSCLGLLRKTRVLGTLASISSWLDDRELDPDLRLAISLSINGSNSFNFQSLLPFPWTKRVLLLYIVITVFWFCSRINVSSLFSFLFNSKLYWFSSDFLHLEITPLHRM